LSTFTVSNLSDSGAGSLREAINAVNGQPPGSSSVIDFNVSGTITLGSALPTITNAVTIDATSAPPGYAGTPLVELNCNNNAGLVFAPGSSGSALLGMAVGGASGNGVTLVAGSITLNENYIGLNLAGSALGNAGDGVFVAATSSNNLIGLNPTAASGVVTNVISGNTGNGISFHGSSGNTLVNNYIGTDATGTTAIANGGNGIWLTGGSNGNEIGGTAFTDTTTGAVNDPTGNKGLVTPVFVVPPLGNLVSGNGQNGILIDTNSQNNVLNGNFVGTTATGNAALGNSLDGVDINGADNNSLIGCLASQNPFVYYNVVSGNGGNGLHITDSNNTTVQANFFGIGADNTTIVGNASNGILADGSSQNVVVGGVIPLGNVSSGNGQNGIEVTDTVSGFTSFNTFGGLLAFKGAAPNGNDGLLITATGGNQTVETNVFSGNLNNGIEIGGNASGVTVDPNIAGLTTNGMTVLANGNDGLLIDGTAHDNIIGGYQNSIIPQNTFSGNDAYGIAIEGQANNNQVFNSYVGLNVLATLALGNLQGGILIGDTANNNTIGGTNPTPSQPVADLISGNTGNGITLENGTSFSQILNNEIGFGRNGASGFPNSGDPIVVNASADNTISGNLIACFAAGTRITTEHGDVAVQALRVGDRVRTVLGGRCEEVIWIGHRHIDCLRHPEPEKVWPVRIAADAFGRGLPTRALFLSPEHAVFANGVLIPVKLLINHRSIQQITPDHVTYYHVELARHDVIMAEGLPTESYLDTDGRCNFSTDSGTVRLFADFSPPPQDVASVWEAMGCARLVVHGPEVDALRKRVEARCRTRKAPAKQPTKPTGKLRSRAG
jgi:parallel beta-helix repeat protein